MLREFGGGELAGVRVSFLGMGPVLAYTKDLHSEAFHTDFHILHFLS
jgi:hypothetical protein